MTKLRTRIADVKRNVHSTLQDMFTAVATSQMEQGDLDEKLAKLEGIVGTATSKTSTTSATTSSTRPSASSGNPVSSFGAGPTTDAPNLEPDPGMRAPGASGAKQAPPFAA